MPASAGRNSGLGSSQRVADGKIVDHLELRALAVNQQRRVQAATLHILVGQDIFPLKAEVLGRERRAVRPFVPRPQMEGENAVLVVLVALQDVRPHLQRAVVGNEAGVAIDGHQPQVALFGHQRPDGATTLADGALRGFVDGHHARLFGKALGLRRQFARGHERSQQRRLFRKRGRDEKSQQHGDSGEDSHA